MKKKDPCSDPNLPVIEKEDFGKIIQKAIELEIATIPVYLYTYYSINRTPNQDELIAEILRDLPTSMDSKTADETAKKLAVEVLVYANQSAALILSVAVEEMLHMALSSNVKQALVGPPDLYNRTPKSYPTGLVGHLPYFPINLAKFSLEQLHTFLLIESPDAFKNPPKKVKKKPDFQYDTIGQFYESLMCCVKKNFANCDDYHPDRPQLSPQKGYYGQNSIDTVYYDKDHNPHFANGDDSGNLIHVKDLDSALAAMHEIVEQGEGQSGRGDHLDEYGQVRPEVCKRINAESEKKFLENNHDRSKDELSHFAKFLELYCRAQKLNTQFQKAAGKSDLDFTKYFVRNVPSNPCLKKDYPKKGTIREWTTFGNAVCSYLFLMTEACYYNKGNTQFEIFMFGIHKAMIWVLTSICYSIQKQTYEGKDGETYHAAVTFERYDFSNYSGTPKEQLMKMATELGANVANISELPDVYLNRKMAIS